MTQGVEWLDEGMGVGGAGDGDLGLPMDRPGGFKCRVSPVDGASIQCALGGSSWVNIGTGWGQRDYNFMDAAWLRYRSKMGRRGRRPFDLTGVGALRVGPVPNVPPGFVNVSVTLQGTSQTVRGLISNDKAQKLFSALQELDGLGNLKTRLTIGGISRSFVLDLPRLNAMLEHVGLPKFRYTRAVNAVSGVKARSANMSHGVEWLEESGQWLAGFGHQVGLGVTWVEAAWVKTLQAQLNVALDACGYYGIGVDGKLGPGTCGAIAALGDMKNADCYDASKLDAGLMQQAIGYCAGWTFPTKKGTTKPDKPTSTLDPKDLALPWGVPDSRTAPVQGDLNVSLSSHDYYPIGVTGVLDAATCGAMKMAEDQWGNNYLSAFGLNCQGFTTPQKRPGEIPVPVNPCGSGEVLLDPTTGACGPPPCLPGQTRNAAGDCVATTVPPTTGGVTKASSGGIWLALLALAAVVGTTIAVTQAPKSAEA